MDNHVLIQPVATDYTVGGITGIKGQPVNQTGNWIPYNTTTKWQSGRFGDKDWCVTGAILQSCEIQLNFQIKNKTLPEAQVEFLTQNRYIDASGSVSLSERFSAILNGTTDQGNSQNAVAQSLRTVGAIPEALLPNDETLTWDQYYDKTKITQAMFDLGKQFLKLFVINYEWVVSNATDPTATVALELAQALQQAPVAIVTPVCPTWSGTIVEPCGLYNCQHSTALLLQQTNLQRLILDHYVPFVKTLDATYPILWGMKVLITTKDPSIFSFHFTKDLTPNVSINDTNEVQALQKAMMTLGLVYDSYLTTFAQVDLMGGYYGEPLVGAVKTFQAKHGLPAEGLVGPATQAALNLIFNV